MCGLVAFFGEGPAGGLGEVPARTMRLAHRGPDGSACRAAGRAILGHRRLAIIDVASGHQPIASEDGGVLAIVNGEIYNHRALRGELEGKHRFATCSDSEIVVHLYEDHGEDFIHKLDGMFALVVTDGDEIVAARDPLGIKPLYWGRDPRGGLWFASELKAIVDRVVEVEEFPPGSVYSSRTGMKRWFLPRWADPAVASLPLDPPQLVARLEHAVVKRLMSDVPVGVLLSGGLDSSLVTLLARGHLPGLQTFSVGLEGSEDLEAARVVARHVGTRHRELVYTQADALAILETVVAHLESYDPALIRSAIPCFLVSRLAADHVKVVLTGEGADEAFGAYSYLERLGDPGSQRMEEILLLSGLHSMNLQRVDRMTMAHGLEGRVPFLDIEFLDHAMAVDPSLNLHGYGRPEKWCLRRSFQGLLPDSILWRSKREFAQGCGSDLLLERHANATVTEAELARAPDEFPTDTPKTKEELLCRRMFTSFFPGEAARRTVARWRHPRSRGRSPTVILPPVPV